ncbi:hypothetical protein [Leptospira kmetyi]|nr:hypothetical protein [Leptospira kmetyi]
MQEEQKISKEKEVTKAFDRVIENTIKKKIDNEIKPEGIPGIINKIHDNIGEIVICTDLFLSEANRIDEDRKIKIQEASAEFNSKEFSLDKGSESFREEMLEFLASLTVNMISVVRKFRRSYTVSLSGIIIRSFYLNLFSLFDAFTGDLLRELYRGKPELVRSLGQSLSIADILEHTNISDIINEVIEKELENMIRESYVEQFQILEKRFNIKLREFKNWPKFVEITQRRNLIMHAGGRVNSGYLSICKKNECVFDKELKVGDILKIDKLYLFEASMIFQEVSFKLGITLWRKLFEHQLVDSDSYMIEHLYNLLVDENYRLVENLGEFCINLPKHYSDANKKTITLNYCIALKMLDQHEKLKSVLSSVDWSSSILDFKLAVSVLGDNYALMLGLMEQIGLEGEYISEKSYIEWPLFRNVRDLPEFQEKFKKIYSKDLKAEIRKDASSKFAEDLSGEH